ncbi:MICOS complex subunit MIC27 [Bombina bombina]|uniref:MICOS complex subunit MIC27 n=1 Tax=Bombina bombina TaxID=8345 RepID=UPI00235B2685|nr:MICOS complex subunit MIC27 [Bombina bombina]
MVSKIIKLASVPAGLAFTSYSLYAISDREPKGNPLNPNQFSVYSVPPPQSIYIDEQPGRLQSGLSLARGTLWPYVIWGKNFFTSIKYGVEDTIQFGKDSYAYLKHPPPEFLPRVGVITVSGLAGLFLARKGTRLKKIVYPLGLTTLGVSVCYPAHAVIFAKVTGKKIYSTSQWTYGAVSSLWQTSTHKEDNAQTQMDKTKVQTSVVGGDQDNEVEQTTIPDHFNTTDIAEPPISSEAQPPHLLNEEAASDQTNQAPTSLDEAKQKTFKPDPKLLDHGQSNPEDVDMYSTRS